jgi:hypothetical protein
MMKMMMMDAFGGNLRREAPKFWKSLPARPPIIKLQMTISDSPLRNPTTRFIPAFDLMKTAHAVASTGVAPVTLTNVSGYSYTLCGGARTYHCGRATLVMVDAIVTPTALAGVLAIQLTRGTLDTKSVGMPS